MTKTLKKILLDETVQHLEQGAKLANKLSALAADLAPGHFTRVEKAIAVSAPPIVWEQEFSVRPMHKNGTQGPLLDALKLKVSGPWDANQKAADAWVKAIRPQFPLLPRGWTIALHALEAKQVEIDQ